MKNNHNTWIFIFPYITITAIIFIFNILSIWGFDGLTIDDQGYYYSLYNKSISDLAFSRNIFHSLFTLGVIKITAFTSVFFARFLILFLLCIPSAFFIYYFSHNHYKAEKYTAITISVLPFILPNEIFVPTYLAGSYMLLATLFAMISIYFTLTFLQKPKYPVLYFILAAIFYYTATESSELIAVMLPVFLFLIFIFRKLSLRTILLGCLLTAIAVRKAVLIINKPHGKINSISNELTASEIKHRILHFMDFINPFHSIADTGFLNILLISIISGSALIVIINYKRLQSILLTISPEGRQKNKYFYFAYYYLFPTAWLVLSALPFLFYSQYFTSRYFLMAAIAISFMLIISVSIIYSLIKNPRVPLVIILLLIISVAGFNRQRRVDKYYKTLADQFSYLEQTFNAYDFPPDAQVIVTAPEKLILKVGGRGNILKSTGTMQYILKRRDIRGQIMNERCFYDPFLLYNKPFIYHDIDIDTTKNTYLLRGFNKDSGQDRRLYYALRWVNGKSKHSHWSILHFEENGNIKKFISGVGYDSYESVVDSLFSYGIKREDILFGGFPTRQDSLRLGL